MAQDKPMLICEELQTTWHQNSREEILANKEKNGGKIVMTTLLQRADRKNQMGRLYPRRIMEREFANYQRLIDTFSSFGELNHPDSAVVSLPASHIIKKQWYKNSPEGHWEWWGDVEIGNNSIGKDVQDMIMDGWRMSISSRAVGTVEHSREHDADVVQDNLVIIAFDIVSQPSTHHAHMHLKECLDLEKNERAYKLYVENKISMLVEMDLKNRTSNNIIKG